MERQRQLRLLLLTLLVSTTTPSSCTAGSTDILDVTHWNIMLPTGRMGDVDHYKLEQLDGRDRFGIRWTRVGLELSTNAGGMIQYASTHPRSELGERKDIRGGAGWSNRDGKAHIMDLVTTVTRLPYHHPSATIMQIKDQHSNRQNLGIAINPRKRHGTLRDGLVVAVRVNGGGRDQVIDDDYRLGRPIRLRIETKARHLTIDYNGKRVIDTPYRVDSGSFKAGMYAKFTDKKDGVSPKDLGTVLISRLRVSHT